MIILDLFSNLLGRVVKLKLPILRCVNVKVLQIVCRFTMAEGKMKKSTVAGARCWFLCSESKKRRE